MNTLFQLPEIFKNSDHSPQLLLTHIPTKANDILNISNSAIHDTFVPGDHNEFTAKSTDDSSVLKGHLRYLPLVPGVVQKGLLYSAFKIVDDIYSGKDTIKTTFGKPILPKNTVRLSTSELELLHENGDSAVKVEKSDEYLGYENATYSGHFNSKIPSYELDRVLLQSNEFRFVTGTTFIRKNDISDLNVGDEFQGYFEIPENFRFFMVNQEGEKIVEPYLIEEMAAQIGVTAFSAKIGEVLDKNNELSDKGSTMTFNSSICRYSGTALLPGGEFRLVGKIKDISKRMASFEYVGFDEFNNEIIRGQICGNIVSLKILKRLFK